jgi:glycosyltransferase involved in cell wall biosynthesis
MAFKNGISMPLVSVIIPTYNRSGLVKEAVESVLSQTVRDLEIIVVDDGSADDTKAVIESIPDKRVKYFYKSNGGVSSARNLGLSKANGEYIGFLDSDDLWPKNYLEVMLAKLKSNSQADIVYSPIALVYTDGRKIESYKMLSPKTGQITADLFKSSFIWVFAMLCRAETMENFFFDESCRVSEDSDSVLRLSLHANFDFTADVEALHRISNDSLSESVGVDCTRLLTLERFYYRLGGDKIIPKKTALKKLSHSCRKIANDFSKKGKRAAALKLYGRAIKYWPFDVRLYSGFIRAVLLNKGNDPEPDWQVPSELTAVQCSKK